MKPLFKEIQNIPVKHKGIVSFPNLFFNFFVLFPRLFLGIFVSFPGLFNPSSLFPLPGDLFYPGRTPGKAYHSMLLFVFFQSYPASFPIPGFL
jgi:hypothetical protein